MEKTFPATEAQKRLLNFLPKRPHCLAETDVDTIVNCVNMVVFVWLTNGNGYWYFIKSVQGGTLIGYVLTNNRWVYHPIEKKQVRIYY